MLIRAAAVVGVLGAVAALGVGPSPVARAAEPKMLTCDQVASWPQDGRFPPATVEAPPDVRLRLGIDPRSHAGNGVTVLLLDAPAGNAEISEGNILSALVTSMAPAATVRSLPTIVKKGSGYVFQPGLVPTRLGEAADQAGRHTVVLLGSTLEGATPQIVAELKRLAAAGAVVVAPVGAPRDDEGSSASPGYDDLNPHLPVDNVVAVSVLPHDGDPTTSNAADSSTSFTVPIYGARAAAFPGHRCAVVSEDAVPARAYAAAEMAGILAAVASSAPDLSLRDWVARLEATGTSAGPTMYVGHGVPQAAAAMSYHPPGHLTPPRVDPPTVAAPPPDVLAATKHHAVWWGLLGGGVLLLALVVRPLLPRRR